jgi:hypothetical protein
MVQNMNRISVPHLFALSRYFINRICGDFAPCRLVLLVEETWHSFFRPDQSNTWYGMDLNTGIGERYRTYCMDTCSNEEDTLLFSSAIAGGPLS